MRLLPLAALAVLALGAAGAEAQPAAACRPVVPSDRAPSWSPDGRHLAFVRRGGGCSWENAVHVLTLANSSVRRLATGGGEHPPAWSPDGTRLAFPSHGRLTVVSLRGDGLDQLARGGQAPAWSPDGRRIAFTFGRQLRVVGVDGSDERLLATGLASGAEPGWSPDGSELVYAGLDGEIHVVDVESSADRIVAGHPSWDAEPVWAGASGAILFVSARSGSSQLWSVTADGRVRQETFGPDTTRSPASSPSGFHLAFVRHGGAEPGVHYWPPETARHFRVSADSVVAGAPAFSGGRYLAWIARGRCGRFGLHVYGPLGAPERERRQTNRCVFRGTRRGDVIRGTPWADVIDAGAGNDVVLTRDSHRDSVRCGSGRDRVDADRKDVVARDCERVRLP